MSEKYADIYKLIEKGKLDTAQNVLNAKVCDDAEWYYLQSWVFYKRGWYLDCKFYLEQACELDPDNQEYKEQLDKLLKQGSLELSEKEQRTKEKRLKRAMRRGTRSHDKEMCCEVCGECACEGCCQGCCEASLSGC